MLTRDERRELEDRCDALWREAVERRDRSRCRKCGKPGHEAAHIFSRGVHFTRWLLENGLWLDRPCHSWSHANPKAFHAWVVSLLGARVYARLWRKYETAGAHKVDLVRTKARLERTLRVLFGGG